MRAVARRGDPATSWAAADSLDPDTLRASQLLVWHTIQDHGPMTDEELVGRLLFDMSSSGARTRRSELADLGLVFDTGDRRVLRSGRRGIVWGARWLSPTPITFGW
jgi:hypothetical protein